MRILLVLLGLLWPLLTSAAIDCDGVDDGMSALAWSNYVTASEKTILLTFTGEGTSPSGAPTCLDSISQAPMGTSANTTRIHINRRSATEVCVQNRDAGGNDQIGTTHTDGTPVTVALVHTGGTLYLYKNGVQATSIASGDTVDMNRLMTICSTDGHNTPFNGVIDQVITYNSALSAGEIAAVAQGRRTHLRKTTPTAMVTFDNCADGASGDGVVFRDLSGNGRTITGADGANNTGLTCRSSTVLGRWGGIQ